MNFVSSPIESRMYRKPVFFAFTLLLASTALQSAEPQRQDSAVSLPATPVWLRQLARVNKLPTTATRLVVSGRGVSSIYMNGQRLGRSIELNDGPVSWDVTKLIREGRNSVALTVNAGESCQLSVELAGSGVRFAANAWKSTTTPPPVGWQQTDFNDRDWKLIKSVKSVIAPADARELTWSKSVGPNRIVDGKLQFQDGDHVVMLGGTFIERAQSFGHLESALNCSTTGTVTFRNLGWSADTVFAESRGIFDSPKQGYERMIEHVRAEEPTVIFLCYGQNAAMNGDWDVDRFSAQLKKLCRDLTTTDAQIILLSPHAFLDVDRPYPSPARWNSLLQEVTQALNNVANSEGLHFVDLFANFVSELSAVESPSMRSKLLGDLDQNPEIQQMEQDSWSDNGMHWTSEGYARVAQVVSSRLFGPTERAGEIAVNFRDSSVTASRGEIRNIKRLKNAMQFEFKSKDVSPVAVAVKVVPPDFGGELLLSAADGANIYSMVFEGLPEDVSEEQVLFFNPEYERLRQLTIKKNELYFYRWRPQNITYLFGFRKHEQGNNASEIAQFDPLISSLEKQITAAKQPQWQTITIAPQEGQ